MRPIDADELTAFLKKLGRLLKVEENHKQKCRLIGNIISYIEKKAPVNPADLAPKGWWRTVKLNRDKGTVLVECSECGSVFDITLFACGLNYNFCPNCGCLMGGD